MIVKNYWHSLLFSASAAFLVIFFSACSSDSTPVPEILYAYLGAHEECVGATDGYCAYFDLSDGMLDTYSDPVTKQNIKSIVNKITGNDNCKQVYALKNGLIEKLEKSQTELYNYILSPKSYAQMAPIEEALKAIVSDDKSAFLVTDFEEYTNRTIQQQNYAKTYFVEWLKKGYDIFFFVMDYKEGKKEKHLYFTVFDSPVRTLYKEIMEALKGNGVNYKIFNLSNNLVAYNYNYMAASKGGCYHESASLEDIVSCTNETGEGDCYTIFKEYNAEFYPFEATWKDIVSNANAMKEVGNEPVFTHLITGPVADFTLMNGYEINALALSISNIQKDFDKFAGYYAFKTQGLNADENGNVLSEFDYTQGGSAISQVEDLFVYSGKIDDGKATVNIDFRPGFSGEIANMNTSDLMRVDVVIADCEPKYDVVDQLFGWEGNSSLSQSVRNTLQEMKPAGKVIYSFFIRGI